MTRTLWLFLLFYAVHLCTFANESPLSVREMRCEFRVVPLGVDRALPRLSWELVSKDPTLHNQVQTAYQILVASSLSLLEEGKADGWNSGRVEGRANNNIYYRGKPLVSGGVYYWKVRIWDGGRMVSSWSRPSQWSMGLLSAGDWGAEWVMDSKAPVADDSLLYQDNPAPLFRKELDAGANIRRAVLYVSGIGYYRATLNGGKVGDHFLDPGWTDYRKTVPYNTFDVTDVIKGGRNCLGVELGNGWYDPLPLRMWGSLNMRKFLPTGKPRFIARLEIEYTNGKHQTVVSDGSWKVTDGPLRRNNNYIGSTYDDRYALPGWDRSGYEDGKWRKALVTSGPGGELVSQEHPPIRNRVVLRPLSIRLLGKGKYLVDMGQNFGGIVRLTASGEKGTRIQLRYGELLYPDGSLNVMTSVAGQIKRQGAGGPGAPPIAWQQDDLILGEGKVVFEPAFTFHGFRYVEIEGYPGVLTKDMIVGIPLASDVRPAGGFSCSDSLFENIQTITLRTFLSNLFSVQSDCPHREKLGYGGDIVATSEAFMANYNMHDFYAKAVRDFADEAQPDGALPETAPYVGIADNGVTRTAGPIGWGTVLPLLLKQLYQYYGDSGLVAKYYPAARAWVDFLHAHAKGFIIKEGIGDHESLDPKQVEVTSTAFLYYNTKLLQQLADILGRREDEERYSRLAAQVKAAFIKNFYDPATGAVGIHTQGTQAFALYFHLLPEGEDDKAFKVLLNEVHNKKDHVSTGIFGTKYLLEVLSQHGMSELACEIAGQKDLPGWGNMLSQGATTLWEHWEYSDNTFSHNHPMFGSISGWFYKYLAGIRPAEEAVGFNNIILHPAGFERLRFARARWHSPQGTILSEWRRNGDSLYYDIAVPVNTSATVLLPGQAPRHMGSGYYQFRIQLQTGGGREALIPYPAAITPGEGHFVINKQTQIVREAKGKLFRDEQTFLSNMLQSYLGTMTDKGGANRIVLREDPSVPGEEGYYLKVSKEQVVLSAANGAGMFYGLETLRQLLPAEAENGHGASLTLPVVDIADHPRYPWRGMHLDVSRHFFSTGYLKKYIDMMALYKLNKLHLHLTDDQGWRIEIKKYPRLTSEGAWRTFNDQDSACMLRARETDNPDMNIDPKHIRVVSGQQQYGGFYTQEEMKEVIRYAALHHVEVIPEIDMPGHMMAAIALYPELTCDGKKGDDWTKGFSTPICPCQESTLAFARDIFSEIAELFPSKYIHIGGDEVERSHWKASPVCQAFMEEHHINSLPQLQSYFNDYMQAFFRGKGKVLLGWDEIVEGGIDSSAAVMFWRPWARTMPAKATANGNKVIMSPDGPFYFDAIPDKKTLSEVYHYDPTGDQYGMNEEQKKNIIGVQANLWSEMVPSEERADYMIMPRMSAMAEVGWTTRDLYDSYLRRLTDHYDRLDRLHINYRLPDLAEMADSRVFVDSTSFMIAPPTKKMKVHYTVDGSWPSLRSPLLEQPVRIDHPMTLRVAAFTSGGRRGDVSTAVFSQQAYATPLTIRTGLTDGLRCGFYKGSFNRTGDMNGAPLSEMVMAAPALLKEIPATGWGLKFTGFIEVPETGVYTFYLNSDDGSILHIAGRLVVDNDGMHSPRERVGQVALRKGVHAFALEYIDGGGGGALELRYSKEGSVVRAVPAGWLKHDEGTAVIKKSDDHPRIINIVNFIRWLEPRDPQITKDVLYQTVVKQIALMKANRLGGTFLLQYDALIDPRYQQLLRGLSRDSFEIGGWWELPQQLVEKAGLKWRGRYSWDWRADVGFAAGYSVEDRKKLVDVYMEDFKQVFGEYPASVGSWYIDAYTLDYMYTKYGIRASCNCKDQVGTDGYTLWGGYWNQAYYPSKLSAYMPAQHLNNQIPVPVFRMLGSDPIRQYEDGLAGGRQGVVTLEPVYKDAGGSETWVKWYLKQLVEGPCMEYGYAQAGQENSFTWNGMSKGLELQFPLIARLRDEGKLKVETLGASGKWFKEHYAVTPATAVTVKEDLPNSQDRKTVWFDSRWYRANLIWANGTMRWRDIHLFDEGMGGDSKDANPSTVSVMSTLPLVDGLWSGASVEAGLRVMVMGDELVGGDPVVSDSVPGKLFIRWPLSAYDAVVVVELTEREMRVQIEGKAPEGWYLSLQTGENAKLPFVKVRQGAVEGRYEGRDYKVRALSGSFSKGTGSSVWVIRPDKDGVGLEMGNK